MATNTLLRRGVAEAIGLASANGTNSGTPLTTGQNSGGIAIPAEAAAARILLKPVYTYTAAPTAVIVPIQESEDNGVTWTTIYTFQLAPVGASPQAPETTVQIMTEASLLRVGPVTLTGGTAPAVVVQMRVQ